jgi:hypothetical protein
VEVVEGVGVELIVLVEVPVLVPVDVRDAVEVVEGVGVELIVLVEVLVLVAVEDDVLLGVIEGVDEVLGVLLSLGHVAPTQQILPDTVPPLLHPQDAQHAPGSHPMYASSRLVLGTEHV